MPKLTRFIGAALACVLLATAPALAVTDPRPRPTPDTERLFLSFAQDATIIANQWWEGQLEYADNVDPDDRVDIFQIRGIVAFQPWRDIELGGRVGFANSSIRDSSLNGTGATDLEAWAKYSIPTEYKKTELSVGGVLTVPTGDDSAVLGTDAFALELFGSIRRRLNKIVLAGNLGMQFNGDGRTGISGDLSGEISPSLGFGVFLPLSERVTFIGEALAKGERFDGGDPNTQLLGGVSWRVANKRQIRGAISFGLTDGAPDLQVIFGYAATF